MIPRKYGEHYEFVDRQRNLIRATREGPKPVGKAYGFFDYEGSKEVIEKELPDLRGLKPLSTPSELELSLIEGVENLRGDAGLKEIVQEAKEAGMTFVLEATYLGATNKQTAEEVIRIFNQMRNSPLYNRPLQNAVVYKEGGEYTRLE